jgi:hypothetical protein
VSLQPFPSPEFLNGTILDYGTIADDLGYEGEGPGSLF